MTQVITNMTLYRALVVKSGIDLYLKSNKHIIPNSSWTPTNMLKAASQITGKPFRRGEHAKASQAIGEWLQAQQLMGKSLQDATPMVNHPDYQPNSPCAVVNHTTKDSKP